jgi:hypothetical protein
MGRLKIGKKMVATKLEAGGWRPDGSPHSPLINAGKPHYGRPYIVANIVGIKPDLTCEKT